MHLSNSVQTSSGSQEKQRSTAKSQYWVFGLIMLIATFVLFYELGARTLNNWDEAIYAQVSKEIVNSGDWLTLHWGYAPWYHKPPLFMWMTALLYRLFEVNEFWARAASALSGLGVVGVTYLISQRLYGRLTAVFSVGVLLTNFSFVHYARFGTTDVTLALFIFISIYAYLRAVAGAHRWWYLAWFAMASALMTKGVAGLIVPIAILTALLVDRQLWPTLRLKTFWRGSLVAALIVLPWHGIALYQHGQAFVDQYFLYHVVERSTNGIEGNEGGPAFYFLKLGKKFFPWVWLLPMAFALQIKEQIQEQIKKSSSASSLGQNQTPGQSSRILLVLVLVVLGGFTLVGTKLEWYVVPCYPVFAIWIGHLITQAIRYRYSASFVSLLVVAAAVCVLAPQRVTFLSPPAQMAVAGFGLVGLTAISGYFLRFAKGYQAVSLVLCGVLVLAGVREIRGLYLEVPSPVAALAESASQSANPNNEELIVVSLSEDLYMPTALFYSNRPIRWVRSVNDLETVTEGEAVLAEEDIELLSRQYEFQVFSKADDLAYGKISKRG